MAQRSEADAECRSELFLGQSSFLPHLLDINLFRCEKPYARFLSLTVGDGLFQPALYAFKKVAHLFPPPALRAVFTSRLVNLASSFRSAAERLEGT
jgi:hypothetical protein